MTDKQIIPFHERPFRIGMGIAVFNDKGQVFIGERSDIDGAWQMPQGGVTLAEIEDDLIGAALRELEEETGITEVIPLALTKNWKEYNFPDDTIDGLPVKSFSTKYRGQRQKWLAVRFHGDEKNISLDHHHEIEFQKWRWEELSAIPTLITPMKRPVYDYVVDCFGYLNDGTEPDLSKIILLSK